ncbi:MAG: redoxin domain-containing protein [Deltaproteobacteria bacterium]|nr:redoxin domain-containing protein [Deltaproteobacteria bacterium]
MLLKKALKRRAVWCLSFLLALSLAGPVLSGKVYGATGANEYGGPIYPLLSMNKLDHLLQTDGKGKVVIITFFASWCPPCRKEIPQLVHLRDKVSEDDMLIIGVSADESLPDLNKFLDRVEINFPVYLGMDDVFKEFEVTAIPVMVLYNSDGTVYQVVEGLLNEAMFNSMVNHLLGKAYE